MARDALPAAVVPPQELLLDERRDRGPLAPADRRRARAASGPRACGRRRDGWYRPLRLALEATGGMRARRADRGRFLEIPPVRLFLRHEVLDAFSEEERELLLDAPDERPAGGAGEDALAVRRRRAGLWVEGPERDRLPRLLAAVLDRERRRRRPPAARPSRRAAGGGGRPGAAETSDRWSTSWASWAARSPGSGTRRGSAISTAGSGAPSRSSPTSPPSPGLQAGREELIEAVWPTEGERTIERNFHPTLSHLRRALEGGAGERTGRPRCSSATASTG